MESQSVNLAIVEADTLFRRTLITFLSSQKNIDVVTQVASLPELSSQPRDKHIHIILIDLLECGVNEGEGVRTILEEFPEAKILVLSVSTDLGLISDLIDTGIHGYVSKSDEPEELLQAISSIAANSICRTTLFTKAFYWNRQNMAWRHSGNYSITLNDRERRILQLLWEEKSNKEIADEIYLSIRTVERIRQEMKEKTGAKSTLGLIKFAIHKKIITEHLQGTFQLNA